MPQTLFATILCPVDFSNHSRQALSYAAHLAAKQKARLVVIFVEDAMLAAAAAVAYDERAMLDKARKELREFVARTVEPYGLKLSAITMDVAVGRPHEEITWTAQRLGCDLIVMGAHGWTGANKLMFGSTTHRVLRESPLPVLATPPVSGRPTRLPRGWPGSLALAPVDLSARDRADAMAAAAVAQQLGTTLELIHVVEPVAKLPWIELDAERRSQQRRRTAMARLTSIQQSLEPAVANCRVETGKPADRIAAAAADDAVGLVIMTRRRRQGLFGPRQGSISYAVLLKAATPVLALPSDETWARRARRLSKSRGK